MNHRKVVLAFSGGLDTSFCALYLKQELGLEVHALSINTGGFSKEAIYQLEQKAAQLNVSSFECLDLSERYYQECIRFLLFGNVLKNGTYPLSVSAERMFQAMAVADYVKQTGAGNVAHGSTGAGNDQVRFDMVFQTQLPGVKIITPIRDLQLSRQEELHYLEKAGIAFPREKATYSINQGLWGTSVGGAETLGSRLPLPESAWPTPVTTTEPVNISIRFEKGEPVALNEKQYSSPVQLIQELQTLAQPYGIGRDIHVGDTIIGIKGRVGFEAAAPLLLIKAHHLLEKHVLTRWQLNWKEQISTFYGNSLHEAQFQEPVLRDMEAFLQHSQARVTGTVFLRLLPYRFELEGIESPYDLMQADFGSYGEANNAWSGEDVKGFTRIAGMQTRIWQHSGEVSE